MISLLLLRFKQLGRIFREVGIVLILVALFACTSFLFKFWITLSSAGWKEISFGLAVVLFIVDLNRTDKSFLKQVLGNRLNLSVYLFFEYALLTSPLVILQLVKGQFVHVLACIPVLVLLALLSPIIVKFSKNSYKRSLAWIPLSLFEIRFFVEKRKVFTTLILLLLPAGFLHISLWILGMIFCVTAVAEIYKHLEPKSMLNMNLTKKIRKHLLFFMLVIIPPTLFTLIAHPSHWPVLVYGCLAFGIALILMISYKYAHYTGLNNQLFSTALPGVFMMLTLIPGFVIVTGSLAIFYFIKAKKNLNYVTI